ncbi:MAG: sigma-70 family RNA polymerase sigma factor [bacterium]
MRIEFIEWIYQASSQSLWQQQPLTEAEQERRERITAAVREALDRLESTDRTILEKYYFEGESLPEIGRALGRRQATIVNRHRRALKALRKQLAAFVVTEFGVRQEAPDCCICQSPRRLEIEALIAAKRPEEPYGHLMRKIHERCGLKVTSPQTIIGHQKYHG